MTMPFQPAAFPYARPRRLRSQPWVRRLVAETTLTPADLIWPLIVHDGDEDRQPVASMPGVFRLSPKEAAKAAGVFWKQEAEMLRQARGWRLELLDEVQDSVNTADVMTKTTGMPEALIAERLLLEIAARAKRMGL
ncbi:MAG TPA: hypothetical protein DEB60_00365 [Brevundimonas sp.]|nr:hypothetical protein [Brevundimonas sp.]